MIGTLLKEALTKKGLSTRQASEMTGIGHSTIARIIRGEWIDLETLVKLCDWLEISPATALNTLGNGKDVVVSSIATLIEAEPKLGQTFADAIRDVENGTLQPDDLRDIVAYATYKLQMRRTNEVVNTKLSQEGG